MVNAPAVPIADRKKRTPHTTADHCHALGSSHMELHQPAIVLVHGFGASVYHWRYNIPALVEAGYRVLALDLLGFGLSDKPLIEYSAQVWRDQVHNKNPEEGRWEFFFRVFFSRVGSNLQIFSCIAIASGLRLR